MKDIRSIVKQQQEVQTLQTLVIVYAEIASNRMRRTRGKVLNSRDFLSAINDIFQEVRLSYAHEVVSLIRRRLHGNKITLLSHNGKSVAVFLSANTGLYGDIVEKTFGAYMEYVRTHDCEVTIVGKLGLGLFQASMHGKPFTFFDLPDNEVKAEQIASIITHIVQYEKITVHFGKFESVIAQNPSQFEISAQTPFQTQVTPKPKVNYLFEPTIEKILVFFESEIFASLFDQTVHESELAKFASRVLAMDKASENIKEYLRQMNLEKNRLKHKLSNNRQLNEFPYHAFR